MKTTIENVINLQKQYEKVYKGFDGLIGIDSSSIHLREEKFLKLFKEFGTKRRGYDTDYPFTHFIKIDGVEIFCLSNKNYNTPICPTCGSITREITERRA